MLILVTGFEPFASSPVNPSEQLVRRLAARPPDSAQLEGLVLPVDAACAPGQLLRKLDARRPDVVVSFGEASGRSSISLERLAVNLLDFRIPDNAGTQLKDQPAIAGAPAAYFSTLPLAAIQASLEEHGIPAERSLSAGAYLCNQVFFTLMHWQAACGLALPAGFIHLPSLPEQVAIPPTKGPSMSLDLLELASRLILAECMRAAEQKPARSPEE